MSDVIRNAIIKLSLELSSPNIKLPDLGPVIQQQNDLSAAIEKVNAANQKAASQPATQAVDSAAAKVDLGPAITQQKDLAEAAAAAATVIREESAALGAEAATAQQSAEATSQSAQASSQAASAKRIELAAAVANIKANESEYLAKLKLNAVNASVVSSTVGIATSMALLTAGTNTSLTKLLPYAFALQGLTGVMTHVSALNRALAAQTALMGAEAGFAASAVGGLTAAVDGLLVSIGPVGWALIVVGAACYAVNKAYRYFIPSQDEVNERLRIQNGLLDQATDKLIGLHDQQRIGADAQMQRADLLKSPVDRMNALGKVAFDPTNDAEDRLRAAKELLTVLESMRQKKQQEKKDIIESINLREQELTKAKDALKVEQEKDISIRASIGALNPGEKKRLDRAVDSFNAGTLTKHQAEDLQKFGRDAGKIMAESFFEKRDDGLAEKVKKAAESVSKQRQQAFESQANVQDINKGLEAAKTAAAAVGSASDEITKGIDRMSDVVVARMGEFIDRIEAIKVEQSKGKTAISVSRAFKK